MSASRSKNILLLLLAVIGSVAGSSIEVIWPTPTDTQHSGEVSLEYKVTSPPEGAQIRIHLNGQYMGSQPVKDGLINTVPLDLSPSRYEVVLDLAAANELSAGVHERVLLNVLHPAHEFAREGTAAQDIVQQQTCAYLLQHIKHDEPGALDYGKQPIPVGGGGGVTGAIGVTTGANPVLDWLWQREIFEEDVFLDNIDDYLTMNALTVSRMMNPLSGSAPKARQLYRLVQSCVGLNMSGCPNGCSAHGLCTDQPDASCACSPGYYGADCSVFTQDRIQQSQVYAQRYALASTHLIGSKHIVEVGGFPVSLASWPPYRALTGARRFTAVDPLLPDSSPSADAAFFRGTVSQLTPAGDEDAVLVMDLQLQFLGHAEWAAFERLVSRCRKVVIELGMQNQRGSIQLRRLLKSEALAFHKVVQNLRLDYSANDITDVPWLEPRRTMIVLEKQPAEAPAVMPKPEGLLHGYDDHLSLVDPALIQMQINGFGRDRTRYLTSHVGDNKPPTYIGLGMWYYSFGYLINSTVSVGLGSGGGFVPRILRQCQRDLGGDHRRTIQVDFADPMYPFGVPVYNDEQHFMRRAYSDIEYFFGLTQAAAEHIAKQNIKIDYLHIDADHTHAGSLKDFEMFYPLMNEPFIISIHDTRNAFGYQDGGVVATVTAIRERWGHELDILEWNHLGTGLAVLTRKNPGFWQKI